MGQRSYRSLLAILLAFALEPGQAQAGETVIHVVYHNHFVRVRPSRWEGDVDQEMTIVLSGRNDVREEFNASSGRFSDSWNSEGTLGDAHWRVIGPNRLQRTKDLPQSMRIDTIEIQRDHCRAIWEYRLKPGFTEYEIRMLSTKQWGFYNEAQMVSSTCDISAR
jgi:hypothetical protein